MDRRSVINCAVATGVLGFLFLSPPDLISQIMAAVITIVLTLICGAMLLHFTSPAAKIRRSKALGSAVCSACGLAISFVLAALLNGSI